MGPFRIVRQTPNHRELGYHALAPVENENPGAEAGALPGIPRPWAGTPPQAFSASGTMLTYMRCSAPFFWNCTLPVTFANSV